MKLRHTAESKEESSLVSFHEPGESFSEGCGGVVDQIHSVYLCAT